MNKRLEISNSNRQALKCEVGSLWLRGQDGAFMLVSGPDGFAAVNLKGENTWRGWNKTGEAAVKGLSRAPVGTVITLEVREDD